MRVPGGGASCLGVGRPGSGALPPLTTRLFGRAAGAHYPLAVGAGAAGMGTRHQPHSARSCELALRAVGVARGRPGGAPLAWVWGVRGRALSLSRSLVRSGVRPGPTTHWLWVQGVRAWGPITNPTARALACCRGGMKVPGGGASCLGVGRPGRGALPPPTSRPFGRAAGAHYPPAVGAGAAGVGTRHQPHSARSCVLWGRHEGARGGRLLPGCAASGVGRSPNPGHSSFRACGRGPLPTGCGCGGCGRGDPSPIPKRALLRGGFARCGGGTRAFGGAPLAWVWVVRGRVLTDPRLPVLSGVRPGPASHLPWVRCAGVGARLSLAPCHVPRFVVCSARFPGFRHPAAVVAWHLSSCRGCGRRHASLACLVAPRGCAAPCPVRSLLVLR